MPRGTRHILTGTLRRTRLGYALEMDGGGVWRLDLGAAGRVTRYLDERVTVNGIRSGFDLLDVHQLKRDHEDWPPPKSSTRWFNRWRKR